MKVKNYSPSWVSLLRHAGKLGEVLVPVPAGLSMRQAKMKMEGLCKAIMRENEDRTLCRYARNAKVGQCNGHLRVWMVGEEEGIDKVANDYINGLNDSVVIRGILEEME